MRNLVLREGLDDRVEVQSAGTGSWHLGHPADPRSMATALRHGISLDGVAQAFTVDHFDNFDLILAVDHPNRDAMLAQAADEIQRSKIRLLLSFDSQAAPEAEVPDPYEGGPEGFEEVFQMCQRACEGVLRHILAELNHRSMT